MSNHTAANPTRNATAWTHATRRIRASLLAIAGAIVLNALLLPAPALAANIAKTYYLRNSGATLFNLTLSETAGTATTESNTATLKTFRDLAISNANTNFAEVGTWVYTGTLPNQAVADLGSASLWIGNSNSDQNGLKADVRVEVLKNTEVIATVDTACLALARTPASAASIDLPAPSPAAHFESTDTLAFRVSARRATGCTGHNSGVFRLHYNRSNRASNFTATINPDADLTITKTDSPDPVTAGQNLTYTVTVSNAGPNNATGVSVSDTLPADLAFVSATPSQGTCNAASPVSCSLGTINAGNNATVTIVATVNPSASGTISNTASVTATEPDPTTPNTATATTTVQRSADLSITKTDSPDPVTPGQNLTYTIQVTNNGPSTASAVTVTDTLPASLTLVSATPSAGSCTTAVSCSLGTLGVGASATVTIVATVSPSATGTISNTASVTATEPDPTTPNTATAETTVEAPAGADLSITKTDSPDPVLQGQELTYTVTVTNNGPAQATGVTLTDTLPAGVTFVSVSPGSPTCSQASGTVTCNLGSIANGNNSVVTIKVTPGAAAAAAGTITNTATASSSSNDPNSGNNTATADTTVIADSDGDGIPDSVDCTLNTKDNVIVDPLNVVPGSFTGIRVTTLQAAVIAASDNDVIGMYANTTENVVVGSTTGSGGKDLLVFGCGQRVTAANAALPVIHVEASAGADDGDTGQGERDIEFVDVDLRNGSGGYLIETSRVGGAGTDTLLKGVRAESSTGVGIKVVGSGNEVRGSNGVKFNASHGIQVTGDENSITENGVENNTGTGIDVTGNDTVIEKNKVGKDDRTGNGAGIRVAGNDNDVLENDVFDNAGDGINVAGNGNLVQKNDVGDGGKGNSGDGIHVAGTGNTVDENNVFANGGDGIDVSGGTVASPNVVKDNDVGDRNKGNQGNGILVGGLGNGAVNPVEIDGNTVKANALAGIKVTGSGHQLKNNESGGSGDSTNGDCEYDLAAGNFDAGGNDADGSSVSLTIPGCTGTP